MKSPFLKTFEKSREIDQTFGHINLTYFERIDYTTWGKTSPRGGPAFGSQDRRKRPRPRKYDYDIMAGRLSAYHFASAAWTGVCVCVCVCLCCNRPSTVGQRRHSRLTWPSRDGPEQNVSAFGTRNNLGIWMRGRIKCSSHRDGNSSRVVVILILL